MSNDSQTKFIGPGLKAIHDALQPNKERKAQARIKKLEALVREMGKATTQLLSGHDQLYNAFFHYLPDRNPLNDLAAKDAREILNRPEVKAIMEKKP